MIQRYENNGYMEDFRPEPKGEWVKYEDHKERVERLEAALRLVKLGLESGAIKAKLVVDMGDLDRETLPMRSVHQIVSEAFTNDAGEGA